MIKRVLWMAVLAAGCGGNNLSSQQAAQIMTTAVASSAQAQAKVMPSQGTVSGSYDGTITNPNPSATGSVHVSGSATAGNNSYTMTFDATLLNWSDPASGITLNGALHESANFTTLSPLVGNAQLQGSLTASGAASGTVDVDLAVVYATSGVSVNGHVGGFVVGGAGTH